MNGLTWGPINENLAIPPARWPGPLDRWPGAPIRTGKTRSLTRCTVHPGAHPMSALIVSAIVALILATWDS